MSILVTLTGFIILVTGVTVIISPSALRELLHRFLAFRWLYWVSAFRVLVGGILAAIIGSVVTWAAP